MGVIRQLLTFAVVYMVSLFVIAAAMLGIVLLTVEAPGAEPDGTRERARRVKVALAIAGTGDGIAYAPCGRCMVDEPTARAEALKTGKTLVLFVGPAGCEKKAESLPDAVLTARVASTDGDAKPRIIVLRPAADKLHTQATLSSETSRDDLRRAATTGTTVLNWYPGR